MTEYRFVTPMLGPDYPVHRSTAMGWSRKHDACRECGTTERHHSGKGLCSRCYMRRFYQERAS